MSVSNKHICDDILAMYEKQCRSLYRFQTGIVPKIARIFTQRGFEYGWKALVSNRRQEIILEAIVCAFNGLDMNLKRWWCPDSSLKHLGS